MTSSKSSTTNRDTLASRHIATSTRGLRRLALISNILLMLLTSASFVYNVQTSLVWAGLLVGAILALPACIALLIPGSTHFDRLLRINTAAIVVLVSIIFLVLYMVLTRGNNDLAINQLITLICALGLCANLQLLMYSCKSENLEEPTVNELLHRVYGGPSISLFLALALVITGLILSLLAVLGDVNEFSQVIKTKLLERGFIPFLTIAMFFWGLFLLLGNYVLLKSEIRTQEAFTPKAKDKAVHSLVFAAFDQLSSETKPRSREARLEQLQLFMDGIWNKVNYFYTLPRFINWAIPIMGFLGTVLGISLASESIADIIKSNDSGFGGALGEAFAPLGIAFDTTLISLTLSLVLMLLQSLMQRWQERGMHSLEQQLRLTL